MNINLIDTIWWTRKSIVRTEKRLLENDMFTQLLLFVYSFFAVCMSILELASPSQNNYFAVSMASLSIFIMCISLFIEGRDFKGRAMMLRYCHDNLNKIEKQAKFGKMNEEEILIEYNQALAIAETYEEIDFKIALVREWLNSPNPKERLHRFPTKFNLIEVVWYKIKRFTYSFVILVLPLYIITGLRFNWF